MIGDFLSAPVPRSLRVRASLQVANTRLPARSFVLLMALMLAGGVAAARGADVVIVAEVLGPLAAAGITLLEGRWWGYSTWELAAIVAAHLLRPGRLELEPREVSLPAESAGGLASRRPRWNR